jgi:DNA-binding GntR family transcriptional regulator
MVSTLQRRRRAPDAVADEPLYLQVARMLREEIVKGVHPVGAQLPTEDELRGRFSVSRYTIREALRRLREDGLVKSRQGAGTVVVPSRSSDFYSQHALSINDLVSFVAGTRYEIESIRMACLDAEMATRIDTPGVGEWLAVRGFRYVEDSEAPVCMTEYYINRDFAAVGRLLQRHQGPIFPLIEDLFALSIIEVHQEIGATLIDPSLATILDVAPASAAVELLRIYRTNDGRIAQVTVNTHPASRFRHSMTMRRVKD